MLRFGTDGVRGHVGTELTESLVMQLGAAVGREFPRSAIVIAHDGRESGEQLLASFAAGAAAQDCVVTSAGLLPTPAVARAAKQRECVGVAITASHNPWHDNGVKVFAPGGRKLGDDEQIRIESLWHAHHRENPGSYWAGNPDPSVADEYVDWMTESLDLSPFDGREVLFDCANGATSRVAGRVAAGLGLRADVRDASPDGRNINHGCGAVHPKKIARECAARSTIGVAFDGDGDRLIAVDENGSVVDGDRIIALLALDMRRREVLTNDTVVVTSMTNLGFHHAMKRGGVSVVTTDVGDRAVLAAMEEGGFVLGGEQSGHIISTQHATTGDGLLAALLLLDLVRRSERSLAEISAEVMQRMPQVLRSVRVTEKPVDIESLLGDDLARERAALGSDGRIVVRTSGTEPVVRIMVEAATTEVAQAAVDRLERLVATRT